MKCKSCRRDLPANAVFCCWCGKKQLKDPELKVPDPVLLPSGSWRIQLRQKGHPSVSVTQPTREQCLAKARAIRAGLIEDDKNPRITLSRLLEEYITSREAVLSPSTIRGYRNIAATRFLSYSSRDISAIPWQRMISDESALVSPKTVKGSWGLVAAALKARSLPVPPVALPKDSRPQRPWLTPEQLPVFLSAAHGRAGELPALLCLHSLRRSEMAALTWDHVNLSSNTITVSGALVLDSNNNVIHKDTNKTAASRRTVPILIPRLRELLESVPEADREGLVYSRSLNSSYRAINDICASANLPLVGVHGLRHSFASLCYHLRLSELETMRLGGWSDYNTVHRIYTHLSDSDATAAASTLSSYFQNMELFPQNAHGI